MFDKIKEILGKIKTLNSSIEQYKKDSIITSLPVLTCVNRAKKLIEENKPDEAEQILKEALSLPNQAGLVYKYLGVIYEQRQQFDLAVENYQISADLEPQDKTIWQKLGFALIKAKEYHRAELAFDNADKIQALNTNTFTGWGMALMKQERFKEAHEKFVQAIKYSKYNFAAIFLCAVTEINLQMYDKAETRLTFLANVCPNANNTFEFARLKYLKKNYDSAIHYAKKSIELFDKMLPAYILLGKIYSEKFDVANSLKYFEEAEQQSFSDSNLYLEWGIALEKFEKSDEAKAKFLKAYELSPENMEITARLGLCCAERKEFDEAKQLLEKVNEKDPDNKIVKQALGIIAYENNETDKAVALFRTDDENFINCYYLAKCYERLGNDTKVKDYYNSAILLNPSYMKAYTDFASYLMAAEDYQEAKRKLRKALKICPDNTELLNMLFYAGYILVKENVCEYNVKETLEIADKIEKISPELFKYHEQKAELSKLLNNKSESV